MAQPAYYQNVPSPNLGHPVPADSSFGYPGAEYAFPINSFPPILRDAIMEVHRNLQAPIELIAHCALGAISLACQGLITIKRFPDRESPVSLYLLGVADSGEGKTPAYGFFLKVIEDFQARQEKLLGTEISRFQAKLMAWTEQVKAIRRKIRRENNDESIEKLVIQLEALLASEPTLPKAPKLILSDASTEVILANLHQCWPSAGIMSDEGGIVFEARTMNRLGMLSALWGGAPYVVDRVTQPSFTLRGARLTATILVQPKTFFEKFLKTKGSLARDNGFLARCLIIQPQSTQGTRFIGNEKPITDKVAEYERRMTQILEQTSPVLNQEYTVLEFETAAQELWTYHANRIESEIAPFGKYHDIRDCAIKMAENVARIAALFHYFENGEGKISVETVRNAFNLGDWFLNQFKRLLGTQGQIPQEFNDARILETWIFEHIRKYPGIQAIPLNYILQKGCNQLRLAHRRDMAINVLISERKIFVFKDQQSGKKCMSINHGAYSNAASNQTTLGTDHQYENMHLFNEMQAPVMKWRYPE